MRGLGHYQRLLAQAKAAAQVTLSSLNRHAVATRADVGLPKATVLAQHCRAIFPEADVEARVQMFTAESEEGVLGSRRGQQPAFVLDAIDNLDTKVRDAGCSTSKRDAKWAAAVAAVAAVRRCCTQTGRCHLRKPRASWHDQPPHAIACVRTPRCSPCRRAAAPQVHLLAACHRRGLPVLSAGGAGAKADPTRLRFCDVAEASLDPLVRAVRHRLRVRHGVRSGVQVLLSTERPRCGLVTTAEQAAAADMRDYQVCAGSMCLCPWLRRARASQRKASSTGSDGAALADAQLALRCAAAMKRFVHLLRRAPRRKSCSCNPCYACSPRARVHRARVVQTIPNFRIRAIPVLGTAPAVFGMAAAAHILCHLAGAPFFPEPPFHIFRPQYETVLEALQEEEAARHGACDHVGVDLEEARAAGTLAHCYL